MQFPDLFERYLLLFIALAVFVSVGILARRPMTPKSPKKSRKEREWERKFTELESKEDES